MGLASIEVRGHQLNQKSLVPHKTTLYAKIFHGGMVPDRSQPKNDDCIIYGGGGLDTAEKGLCNSFMIPFYDLYLSMLMLLLKFGFPGLIIS